MLLRKTPPPSNSRSSPYLGIILRRNEKLQSITCCPVRWGFSDSALLIFQNRSFFVQRAVPRLVECSAATPDSIPQVLTALHDDRGHQTRVQTSPNVLRDNTTTLMGTLALIPGCFHLLEQPHLSWTHLQIPFSLLALYVPSSNSSPALSNPFNHPQCPENL